MKKYILLLLLPLLLSPAQGRAQSKAQLRRLEQVKEIQARFDSRQAEIFIDRAVFLDKAPFDLGSYNNYMIRIAGDSLYCQVPYFEQFPNLTIADKSRFFNFHAVIEYLETAWDEEQRVVATIQVSADNGFTYTMAVVTERGGLSYVYITIGDNPNAIYEERLNRKKK